MMTIKNKFDIGQLVFLATDPDQLEYQILHIKVTPNGLLYGLSFNGDVTEHYAMEISETKDFKK